MSDISTALLGRKVEHDPRSRKFPAPTEDSVHTVLWRNNGPRLNQWVGSCTGHASADALNTKPYHKPRAKYFTDEDAMRWYTRATQLDGVPGEYPGEDTGSTGLAVSKALKEEGRIQSYEHAFGFDHMLGALMRGPLLFGTNWYEGMMSTNSKGFVEPTGNVAGGHEYAAVGANLRGQYLTFLQSWGPSWGKKGLFYMSFPTVQRLLAEEGDVISLVV